MSIMCVTCNCEDCRYNDGAGSCNLDEITITDNYLTSAGFFPRCIDYVEE